MSRSTLDTALSLLPSLTGLSPFTAGLSSTVLLGSWISHAVRTPVCTHTGLGSFHFARRYFGNRIFSFSSSGYLDVSSSPGSACTYGFSTGHMRYAHVGFPIQISMDQGSFAPPYGFSQLITSFIGSQCQGIHPALFFA